MDDLYPIPAELDLQFKLALSSFKNLIGRMSAAQAAPFVRELKTQTICKNKALAELMPTGRPLSLTLAHEESFALETLVRDVATSDEKARAVLWDVLLEYYRVEQKFSDMFRKTPTDF